jgi:3-(3-hydroxy-phenyl)propionate hydroxylase
MTAVTFGGTRLDLSELPTRHPYTLALFQNRIERLLLGWAEELGVPIRRGVEVTEVVADETGVAVRQASGESLRARYVVGADGGRSVVRRDAGIAFVGPDATRSSLIAEVQVTEELPRAGKIDARGVHGLHPLGDGTVRVVVTEAELAPPGEPTLDDLRRALTEVFGTDFGVHSPTWLSRFTDATRQAASYRAGRVLLAGDAAHVHSPTGGLGIGLGLQDAVNLGWKLARVARGVCGEELLDTYHAERRPAGERALKYTMAQSLFQRADPRQEALRDLLDEVLRGDCGRSVGPEEEARRDHEGPAYAALERSPGTPIAALITGLDVAYDLGAGHPLLGRRMPDLDLVTADGPVRMFELLHRARPVLLDLGGPPLDAHAWSDRVRYVRASYRGGWELPVLGEVSAPTAALVRPDGYVGWVGEGSTDGLADALRTWCGAASR